MEHQQRLQIETLEASAEETERIIKKLEKENKKLEEDNKKYRENYLKISAENIQLKKNLEGKLVIIKQLKNLNETSNANTLRQPLKGKENAPVYSIRTVSTDIQDDAEENPEFKVTCNKILYKMQPKTNIQKRNSSKASIANSAVYSHESTTSNKENIKANFNKPIAPANTNTLEERRHFLSMIINLTIVETDSKGSKVDSNTISTIVNKCNSKV